jgi:GH24 family phage-related lysozyme (muramidase)
MDFLRKGSSGLKVRELQVSLNKVGIRIIIDNMFGSQTDTAVRTFQRRHGLLPDGIAGPLTIKALGAPSNHQATGSHPASSNSVVQHHGGFVAHAAGVAKRQPAISETSRPAAGLRISSKGIQFIYTIESMAGVSNHLYWPKGASGVTLGAGYDMKERSSSMIEADLVAIGLDKEIAKQAAKAAGLKDDTAKQFAKDNKHLINLTADQEMNLLKKTVLSYEASVKRAIKIDLMQHEFDALVSFKYNPGGRFKTVVKNINQGLVADAMKSIKLAVTSKGQVLKGLVIRRDHEVALYLYGNYGYLRR